MSTLLNQIKSPWSQVFRRAYVKRRLETTGLFETSWQEITSDVKKWGSVKAAVDAQKINRFTFSNLSIQVANNSGRYNPEDVENSLWYGYASRQRSLVKIEAGFLHATQSAAGIWTRTEFPTSSTLFTGVISGDMFASEDNSIDLNIKPLVKIFEDFPAKNLTGFTSTGITASQFVAMLRDQTDGSSNYVFRPFFGDTTTYWQIASTTQVYGDLNTSTADEVLDKNCWQILQILSESENKIPYVKRDGTFVFGDRTATATADFQFYGAGSFNTEYGHTIKKISKYGKKISDYYSRVQVRWHKDDTHTSFSIVEATLSVSGTNDPWNTGHRTFELENFYIATSTVALTIAQQIYDNFSSVKNHIEFTTTFVPHLELLSRIEVTFDTADRNPQSLWDYAYWDTSPSANIPSLYWDDSGGDSINLNASPFMALSVEVDLDKLECRFTGRQV